MSFRCSIVIRIFNQKCHNGSVSFLQVSQRGFYKYWMPVFFFSKTHSSSFALWFRLPFPRFFISWTTVVDDYEYCSILWTAPCYWQCLLTQQLHTWPGGNLIQRSLASRYALSVLCSRALTTDKAFHAHNLLYWNHAQQPDLLWQFFP